MANTTFGLVTSTAGSDDISWDVIRPARRITTSSSKAMQAPVKGRKDPSARRSAYQCSRHKVEYWVQERMKPVCPVCDAESRIENLRNEMEKLANANEILRRDLARANAQLSHLDGMREAVSELGEEDRMFLKDMLYRYKFDPKKVRVSQAIKRVKVQARGGTAYRDEVVGWRVSNGTNETAIEHVATSIGGRFMALQFSEAIKVSGLRTAMEVLNKALSGTMGVVERDEGG